MLNSNVSPQTILGWTESVKVKVPKRIIICIKDYCCSILTTSVSNPVRIPCGRIGSCFFWFQSGATRIQSARPGSDPAGESFRHALPAQWPRSTPLSRCPGLWFHHGDSGEWCHVAHGQPWQCFTCAVSMSSGLTLGNKVSRKILGQDRI